MTEDDRYTRWLAGDETLNLDRETCLRFQVRIDRETSARAARFHKPQPRDDRQELMMEIERLRGLLIDPGQPAWEDGRAVLVTELKKNGYSHEAKEVAAGFPAMVPSWVALKVIAHATLLSYSKVSAERQFGKWYPKAGSILADGSICSPKRGISHSAGIICVERKRIAIAQKYGWRIDHSGPERFDAVLMWR